MTSVPVGGRPVELLDRVRTLGGSVDDDLGPQQFGRAQRRGHRDRPSLGERQHRGARVRPRPSRRHVHRHRQRAIADAQANRSQPLPVRARRVPVERSTGHLRAAHARMEQCRHLRRRATPPGTKLQVSSRGSARSEARSPWGIASSWTSRPRTIPDRWFPEIPGTVDGLFLSGTTVGGPIGGTYSMAPRWRETHAPLKRHLVVGWGLLYPEPDKRLRGVVGSSPDPFRTTPAWRRYMTAFRSGIPRPLRPLSHRTSPTTTGSSPCSKRSRR